MGTRSTRGTAGQGARAPLSRRLRPAALSHRLADFALRIANRRRGPAGLPFRLASVTVLLASLTLPPAAAAAVTDPPHEPLQSFPQADLVVDLGGRTHAFRVWVAATEPRRQQGLMWVRELKRNHGMLFVFDRPQLVSFWMKNTFIPLDMLFIAPDGRVIRIAANTTPQSLAPVASLGVVKGVLELAGGTAARLGLAVGDRVRHPAFTQRQDF